MKTNQFNRASLVLIFALAALAAGAAPNYKPAAVAIVTEYLQQAKDPASDDEWKQYAEERKITGKGLATACATALKTGREIIKDGTAADSEFFAAILADSIGVARSAAEPTRTTSQPSPAPAPKPAEDESKTVDAGDVITLTRLRLDEKELKAKLEDADAKLAALGEGDEKARKEQQAKRTGIYHKLLAATKEIRALKTKHALAVAQKALQEAETARTALGDSATTADKTKAEEKVAAAKLKATAALAEDTNAKSSLSMIKATTGDKDILKEARELVGPLRKYGFSVTAGMGTTINDRDSATLAAVFVRYNLHNARTLQKWYSPATAGGGGQTPEDPRSDVWYAGFTRSLTFNGPIVGHGIDNEKIAFGSKLERPWIVGWGLGMGLGPEASSAIYLDLGATVSPTSGFSRSKPYVGLSFDAAIAASLLQTLGAPFSVAKPPAQN